MGARRDEQRFYSTSGPSRCMRKVWSLASSSDNSASSPVMIVSDWDSNREITGLSSPGIMDHCRHRSRASNSDEGTSIMAVAGQVRLMSQLCKMANANEKFDSAISLA